MITDATTTLKPFSSVTIADVDFTGTETVTITLSSGSTNGTLSSGTTYVSAGFYTLTGSASFVTTAVEGVVFTPTDHQVTPASVVTTSLNLTAAQLAGGTTSSATSGSSTIVAATAVNDAQTIAGVTSVAQAMTDATTTLQPFASVTISDVDFTGTETVTMH